MSLPAWYGLLVHAYLPGPRRTEILDTLAEAAPPGRRTPPLREVADLIRHGPRAARAQRDALSRPRFHR